MGKSALIHNYRRPDREAAFISFARKANADIFYLKENYGFRKWKSSSKKYSYKILSSKPFMNYFFPCKKTFEDLRKYDTLCLCDTFELAFVNYAIMKHFPEKKYVLLSSFSDYKYYNLKFFWKLPMSKHKILFLLFKKIFLDPKYEYYYKHADAFYAHGGKTIKYLKKKGVNPSKIAGTPIQSLEQKIVMAKKKRKDKKMVVFFMGRLMELKGVGGLIEAFRTMKHRNKAELRIAGNGELMNKLKKQAGSALNKDIFFLGFVQAEKKYEELANADILVLPSFVEEWGLVVNEAMCHGKAVIVSKEAGSSVLVKGNGFRIPANRPDILRKKLDFLASHPKELERMKKKSYEVIRKYNNPEDAGSVLKRAVEIANGKTAGS